MECAHGACWLGALVARLLVLGRNRLGVAEEQGEGEEDDRLHGRVVEGTRVVVFGRALVSFLPR